MPSCICPLKIERLHELKQIFTSSTYTEHKIAGGNDFLSVFTIMIKSVELNTLLQGALFSWIDLLDSAAATITRNFRSDE